jgi:hypothetical protein
MLLLFVAAMSIISFVITSVAVTLALPKLRLDA